jgi:hypothetical protein
MASWTRATIFRSDPGRPGKRPPVGPGNDHHRQHGPWTSGTIPELVPGSLHQPGWRLRCRDFRVPVGVR